MAMPGQRWWTRIDAMIVQPNLTTHPKFLMFKQALGDPCALEYLLRLWGHCQVMKRGGEWGKVTADYVEAVCIWSGSPGKLFEAFCREFCGKPGWIKANGQGKITITGWNEHNAKLVSDWTNGSKGGRPRKQPTPNPSGTHGLTQGAKPKTHRKPMGDPIGLDRTGLDGSGVRNARAASAGDLGDLNQAHFAEAQIPALEEVLAYCAAAIPAPIPAETGRAFFEHYEKTRHPKWTDDGEKRFQWRGKLDAWHRRDLERGRGLQKPAGEKTREQLEALLGVETDPARRQELKQQLKKAAV